MQNKKNPKMKAKSIYFSFFTKVLATLRFSLAIARRFTTKKCVNLFKSFTLGKFVWCMTRFSPFKSCFHYSSHFLSIFEHWTSVFELLTRILFIIYRSCHFINVERRFYSTSGYIKSGHLLRTNKLCPKHP